MCGFASTFITSQVASKMNNQTNKRQTSTRPTMPDLAINDKLHVVAMLMDKWTRAENEACNDIIDTQNQEIMDLKGNYDWLVSVVSEKNRIIGELEYETVAQTQLIQLQEESLRSMARVIQVHEAQLRMLLPQRTHGHAVVTDPNLLTPPYCDD